MTLKQIEYYMAVCQAGSLSAAAERLYISRTVLSRSMRDLEQELGLTLFVRCHNGMELTESGQMLSQLFSQFSGVFTTLQSKIDSIKERTEYRSLSVGIAVSCGCHFYPEMYQAFHRTYPDIRLLVRELSSYDAYKMVADGTIDVILTPIAVDSSLTQLNSLGYFDLYPTETVLCVAKDSPLAGKSTVCYQDIQHLPLAALNAKTPVMLGPLHVSLRTGQQNLLHKVIVGGTLAAILPLELAEEWSDIVTIPLDPPLRSMVKAVWNETMPQSSALKDFQTFLQSNYRSGLS